MNKHAQALGRLNKGVSKHYSKEEIEIRTLRLVGARGKRWGTLDGRDESEEHGDVHRRGK